MALRLTRDQADAARGGQGTGVERAMRLITALAEATGASRLLPITRAHIDGVLYHGQASLDLVAWLSVGGGRVRVPTTLNVAAVDLVHPWLFRGDPTVADAGRRLVEAYLALGCAPTLSCAPYQAEDRPALGEQVAWAESNAIVFVNSVLGARSARYGDFTDIAAAMTGWVPDAGLHRTEHRRASLVVTLDHAARDALVEGNDYGALGLIVGVEAAGGVPAILGIPPAASEDDLKALGAAAASSGSVALFHAVGRTPEAERLEDVIASGSRPRRVTVDVDMLRSAAASLGTIADGRIDTVSLGTPHFSIAEFDRLRDALVATPGEVRVPFLVSTGRSVAAELEARGWMVELEAAGITLVTDTCTYITPILADPGGVTMTNSAKWAYYAPANLGGDVVFGSLRECVASAKAGTVVRLRS